MAGEAIHITIIDNIGMVALNRPEKRNAMNGELVNSLLQALATLAQDPRVSVLLLQGEGEHFCAGADISWMKRMATGSPEENSKDAKQLAQLMYQLYVFPKPTIVLAHGMTLGGGMGLLAACDIAIAAKEALFGFSEVKIGLVPSVVSPYVISAIGERWARYYFLTGEQFNAEEAHRLGLVQQLTEANALLSTGMTLTKMLLANAPNALMETKQLLHEIIGKNIDTGLSVSTAQRLAKLRASAEAQEGLAAFLEKRKPKWH